MAHVKNGCALFLDLDGTLAQSVDVLVQVYLKFLGVRGKTGTMEEFARLNGPSLGELVHSLVETHGLAGDVHELLNEYRSLVHDAYATVEPNAGAQELVDEANAWGWRICVVTSNSEAIASSWLARVGLASRITHLITGERVTRSKPDPEIYTIALTCCGVAAENGIAVEDAPQGATSAVRAGLETFVLWQGDITGPPWPAGVKSIQRLDDLVPILAQRSRRG